VDHEPGFRQGLPGGDHGELDEPAHAAGLLAAQADLRLEVLYLARHLARHPRGIEGLDPPRTRPSRLYLLPGLPCGLAERGEHAGAGDDDPGAVHHSAVGAPPQRRQVAAQPAPAPQETSRTTLPRRTRPSATASKSAIRGADRKSTRLNSSRLVISYAVFCLKK